MSERDEYGFCPKCGAVTQNGVCQSCGYGKRMQDAADNRRAQKQTNVPRKKRRSTGEKVVIGLCIGIGILVLLCFLSFFILMVRTASREPEPLPGYGGYNDGYFGYGDPYTYDDYGYYIPDADDEYYQEITDATELGLSYGVTWKSVSMRPDDPDNSCTYDCVYPVLTGEDTVKLERMNDRIEQMVCSYQDTYETYEDGVSSDAYVTFMDEEKVSVVVKHELNTNGQWLPRIDALTFRMDTGELISHGEMQEVDDELVRQFRARDSRQNGTVEFVEQLSDEELKAYLADEEKSVMFYTPVGLEIGFNYDGGWVTVTLKHNSL